MTLILTAARLGPTITAGQNDTSIVLLVDLSVDEGAACVSGNLEVVCADHQRVRMKTCNVLPAPSEREKTASKLEVLGQTACQSTLVV